MARDEHITQTGGREATTGYIAGNVALAVGMPPAQAPSGWEWRTLTDLARLETGHTPSRAVPEYWNGDIPWIGIRDATGNHGRTIDDTEQHTTQAGIDNSSARLLPTHTVCLSRTASVGYVVVMGRPMATSQDFVNWVCDPKKLDYRFLKYVLLAEKESFGRFAHGTTHQTIYFPEVKAFHICSPSLAEQGTIAGVLGALDDKIELNRRTNVTLEALARALFQSWFVDFDPVRAKAEGRKPAGLDAATARLFPDGFEKSPLGKVPKEWKVAAFGEYTEAVRGLSYKGAGLSKAGGMPLHNLNSVYEGGGYKYEGIKYYTGEFQDRHKLRPGDVIVTNTEQGHDLLLIGYPAIVPKRFGTEGLFSHHLYRVRPLPGSPLTSHFIWA